MLHTRLMTCWPQEVPREFFTSQCSVPTPLPPWTWPPGMQWAARTALTLGTWLDLRPSLDLPMNNLGVCTVKSPPAANCQTYCSTSLFLFTTRTLSEAKHAELSNH